MSTPVKNTVGYSSSNRSKFDKYTASILSTVKWNDGGGASVKLTYSFPWTNGQAYATNPYGTYGGLGEFNAAYPLSLVEQNAVKSALAAWSSVGGLTFTKVQDKINVVGDLRFAETTVPGVGENGHAYYPGARPDSGDVWLNRNSWHTGSETIQKGSYDYYTLLHETGHALGLKHPHDNPNPKMPDVYDTYSFTIMSYNAFENSGVIWASIYPTTPMYYDLKAIWALYGAKAHNPGNNTYTYSDTARYWQTLDDSGGVDTLVYNGTAGATINLNPGNWSTLGLPITFGSGPDQAATVMMGPRTIIENAYGSEGNDVILGNKANNKLFGRGGDDELRGGKGNDILDGGPSKAGEPVDGDTLWGGPGADKFYFKDKSFFDTVVDFNPVQDLIYISRSAFGLDLPVGRLPGTAFFRGPAANDPDDRLIYNPANGQLVRDMNGSDPGGDPSFFIVFSNKPALTAADIFIIA